MEHGEVKSVNYSSGVVYCNVQPVRVDIEYQNVPVLNSHSGFVQVPKQGQTVAMQKLDDGTRFISDVVEKSNNYPGEMKEGELGIQLDSDTRLYFEKASDGTFDIHLSASRNINFIAPGNILIEAKKEARFTAPNGVFINGTKFEDHTHDYDDDDGSSVSTKTTTSPN